MTLLVSPLTNYRLLHSQSVLVFAALTPHSPLLLPSVNKEQLNKVAETRKAMELLAGELYSARPDTIVIISSHATMFDEAFSVNLHDEFSVDLNEFGDLSTQKHFAPDLMLIDRIQRSLRKKQIKLTLSSDAKLDYGAAVPLLLLAPKLPQIKIVPISYSGLSPKEHFAFGDALKDVIMNEQKRVAVIATGDQSHTLTSDAPAGYAKEGVEYDAVVQRCITNMNTAALLKMDAKKLAKAKECSYRPLLMLLGVLERVNYTPVVHSYESPFGVGYLVVHFELT
jgi:AmmeMemoRadiSam system protein B